MKWPMGRDTRATTEYPIVIVVWRRAKNWFTKEMIAAKSRPRNHMRKVLHGMEGSSVSICHDER